MLFNDVIGQQNVKQHLSEMVEQNRLSHALLFLGKEGSGALPLALAFAQYVVSLPTPAPVVEDLFGGMTALEPKPAFISPDNIASEPPFQRAEQLIHPDLHFTYPVIPKNLETNLLVQIISLNGGNSLNYILMEIVMIGFSL